ncbi:MAG TPA: hypothetical protein VFA60_14110 [Terriglobales bacterium]|nr:hypothetical protein [Terriglobales bacterium]
MAARGTSLVAGWREARRLYPLYMALAAQFRLGEPPYKDVRALRDGSEPEIIERVGAWMSEMDDRIQVHQFRQILQNADSRVTEDRLHSLINRYLSKPSKTEADRDKLDFLLAQYFAVCAPPSFQQKEITLEDMAEVLEPVLGECPTEPPSWLEHLEPMIADMQRATSLRQLLRAGIIEKGREAKAGAGEKYFGPSALLTFTRFTWLLRRHCTRLRDLDLDAIETGLRKLGESGVESLDCRSAGLQTERLAYIEEICRTTRTETAWAYGGSSDSSFARLMELRAVVEGALSAGSAQAPARASAANAELAATVAQLRAEVAELRAAVEAMHSALQVALRDRGSLNTAASSAASDRPVLELDAGEPPRAAKSAGQGVAKMAAAATPEGDVLRI